MRSGSRNEELEDEIRAQQAAQERDARVFAAGTAGDVVSIARGRRPQGRPEPGALVLYNRYRRR
jgi:MerR family transcriptional regulator/heat shock protein HspR